jgi:hypothetical protein
MVLFPEGRGGVEVEDYSPSLLPLEKVNWYYFPNFLPLEGGGSRWG